MMQRYALLHSSFGDMVPPLLFKNPLDIKDIRRSKQAHLYTYMLYVLEFL